MTSFGILSILSNLSLTIWCRRSSKCVAVPLAIFLFSLSLSLSLSLSQRFHVVESTICCSLDANPSDLSRGFGQHHLRTSPSVTPSLSSELNPKEGILIPGNASHSYPPVKYSVQYRHRCNQLASKVVIETVMKVSRSERETIRLKGMIGIHSSKKMEWNGEKIFKLWNETEFHTASQEIGPLHTPNVRGPFDSEHLVIIIEVFSVCLSLSIFSGFATRKMLTLSLSLLSNLRFLINHSLSHLFFQKIAGMAIVNDYEKYEEFNIKKIVPPFPHWRSIFVPKNQLTQSSQDFIRTFGWKFHHSSIK
jgi:hypothetical protein